MPRRRLTFASPAAALAALALAAPAAAAEQLRPMCADRPGKATPPCIVDAGHFQLEVGLADWTNGTAADRVETETFAAFEARLGLASRTEVELAWTPVSISRSSGTRAEGVGDLTFGVRHALTSPDGPGPLVSIQPFVSAPVGTHGQGSGRWGGGLLAPVTIPLGAASIGFTPQLQTATDGDKTHLDLSSALGLSYPVSSVTVGAELWGAVEPAVDHTGRATVDLFAAWSPKALRDVQFDAGVNAGLTRYSPRLEISVGVSHRF
jgi:hypothetical protein